MRRIGLAAVLVRRVLAGAVPAFFAGACFLLFSNLHRGFDITDESFYVLWADHPADVLAWYSRFGFYTGILFRTVGGDLVLFRWAGFLALMAAAAVFSCSLEAYRNGTAGSGQPRAWLFHIAVVSGTLGYNNMWLPTPSYNWLALTASLLAGAGLLSAARKAQAAVPGLFWEGALLGACGALAFLAKPTTGAVLAGTALLWMWATPIRGRKGMALAAVSLAAALLFLAGHAFYFEGGPAALAAQLREGIRVEKLLDGGHSGWDIVAGAGQDFHRFLKYLTRARGALAVLAASLVLLAFRRRPAGARPSKELLTAVCLSLGPAAWLELALRKAWTGGDDVGTYIGYPALAFSFYLVLSGVLVHAAADDRRGERAGGLKGLWVPHGFLVLLGVGYAAGSNLGIIRQMSFAAVFPAAASMHAAGWIDRRLDRPLLVAPTALLLVLSMLLVNVTAYGNPYRTAGTMSEQVHPVTFAGGRTSLRVDEKTAAYVGGLQKLAAGGGWTPGTPLIDMTGGSPGAILILDGRFVGVPWLLGGYKGSDAFAREMLSKAPEAVLRSAWVLTAPAGDRRLGPGILADLGLEFPGGYDALGEVRSGHRDERQFLYRPAGKERR